MWANHLLNSAGLQPGINNSQREKHVCYMLMLAILCPSLSVCIPIFAPYQSVTILSPLVLASLHPPISDPTPPLYTGVHLLRSL